MNSTDVPPSRVRMAIALSLAVHLCAFWLLALLLSDRLSAASTTSDETSGLMVTTIEHRAALQAVRPAHRPTRTIVLRAAPAAVRTPPPIARAAVPEQIAVKVRPAAQPGPRQAAPGASRATLALVLTAPTPALTPKSIPTVAAATPLAVPSPTPTPTPTPAATPLPTAGPGTNFDGLFSQNYPPALAAPSDLAAIQSRLGGPVRIRVEVDETGRATEVHFVGPVPDPALEEDIRSRLLALHYVPADCNGLHCEGTLEIKY